MILLEAHHIAYKICNIVYHILHYCSYHRLIRIMIGKLSQRTLLKIVEEICYEEAINISYYANNWYLILEKNGRTQTIWGYRFDANGGAELMMANDKYITHEFLEKHSIRTPHCIFFMTPDKCARFEIPYFNTRENFLEPLSLPVVVRQNRGGHSGNNISLHYDFKSAQTSIKELHTKELDAVISSFIPNAREFRCIIFDKKIYIHYEKIRQNTDQDDGFKHNLSRGALVHEIPLPASIADLTDQAMAIIPLRMYSLDVLLDENNTAWILEINSGVMTEGYIRQGGNLAYQKAKHYYKTAIMNIFNSGL